MKIRNSSDVDLIYDDPVTGKTRKILAQTEDWCQPSANLPTTNYVVLDQHDGYGKITRRTFVTAADIAANPTKYNPQCLGQVLYIDEFTGVGDSQALSGRLFKRSRFEYADLGNPTKWTTISETEQREA